MTRLSKGLDDKHGPMKATHLKSPIKVLRLLLKQEYLEEIEGDLLERYEQQMAGKRFARLLLWIETIKLIRPKLLKPLSTSKPNLYHPHMISHHLKVSFRMMKAHKRTAIINLVGLTAGMASTFLLLKYIGFFYTVDNFHEKKEHIHAIHQTLTYENQAEKNQKSTYNGVAPLVHDLFPEVSHMSRYITTAETLVRVDKPDGETIKYNELRISEVDPDFLKMFTVDFLKGDPVRALEAPNTMLLSRSMAKKYFGDKDPVGQTMTTTKSWGEKRNWTVTGVFEDYPKNSCFKFNALQSLAGKEFEVDQQDWQYPFFKSFILLKDPQDRDRVAEKLGSHVNGLDAFQTNEAEVTFQFVPLTDTVLSDSQKVLIAVTIFLILITGINYTYLTTTLSLNRSKEFGIRKVMGCSKVAIARQFTTEALVIFTLASVLAFALIALVYPALYRATSGQILRIFEFGTPINTGFVCLLILGGCLSAILPASTISQTAIMHLVRNRIGSHISIHGFRKLLVSLQLIIALVMLTGMITIYKQMQYTRNKDLGIATAQTLILKGPKDEWEGKLARISTFKKSLLQLSGLTQVSSSTSVPFRGSGAPTIFRMPGSEEDYRTFLIGTDGQYFDGYDIEFIAGESYRNDQFKWKRTLAVINETASKKMGFFDPGEALNKKIINTKTGDTYKIVGVVKDYHHQSLKTPIRAQVFNLNPFRGFISVHLNLKGNTNTNHLAGTIEAIEAAWQSVYSDQAFDYYFLDEQVNGLYEEERFFQQMFVWFTSVSVIITFLGIFGLSMFISLQRRKEMGIRKVIGANPIQILKLFYAEFSKNIIVAIIIGAPVAYYLMTLWLSNFTYRFTFSAEIFLIPVVVLSLFMTLTLSFEGGKMVTINPIKILKDE